MRDGEEGLVVRNGATCVGFTAACSDAAAVAELEDQAATIALEKAW